MQRGKTEHRFVNLHMHVLLKLPENKLLWNGFFSNSRGIFNSGSNIKELRISGEMWLSANPQRDSEGNFPFVSKAQVPIL